MAGKYSAKIQMKSLATLSGVLLLLIFLLAPTASKANYVYYNADTGRTTYDHAIDAQTVYGGGNYNFNNTNFSFPTGWFNGNVGVGTTSPGSKLYVSGSLTNTLATTHSMLGSSGNVLVMADNTGALYSTTTASFINNNGLSLWHGNLNGDIWNGDAGVGRVGIGTTAPQRSLSISGTGMSFIGAESTIASQDIAYITDATRVEAYIRLGKDNAATVRHGVISFFTAGNNADSNGGAERMRITSEGNVGIGTTGPSTPLAVKGVISVLDETGLPATSAGYTGLMFSGYNATGTVIGRAYIGDGTGYSFNFAKRTGSVTTDLVTIKDSGYVGIGTTTPSTNLQIGNRTTFQNVVSAQSLYGNNVYYNGGWKLIEAASGSAVRLNSPGSVGDISFHTIVSGAAGADVSTEMDGSGVKMIIKNNGNVGIGITAPGTNRLYVAGGPMINSLSTTHSLLGSSGNVLVMADNTGALYSTTTASFINNNGLSLWHGNLNGDIWNGDAGVGRVGIGTTNPIVSLQVKSAAGTGYNGVMRLEASGSTSNYFLVNNATGDDAHFSPSFSAVSDASSALGFYGAAVNDSGTSPTVIFDARKSTSAVLATKPLFRFENFTTPVLDILANGNVGIGTTAPNAKLEVSGIVYGELEALRLTNIANIAPNRGTSQTFYIPAGTVSTEIGGKILVSRSSDNFGSYMALSTMTTNGTGVSEKVRINYLGNVGIGTTAPQGQLSFSNQIYNSGVKTYSTKQQNVITGYYSDDNTQLYTRYLDIVAFGDANGVAGNSAIRFLTNSLTNNSTPAEQMRITGTGNVGIGITDPGTNRLYVAGGPMINSLSTTHSLLGSSGNVLVMADNTGALYSTTTASFINNNGLSLWHGNLNGDIWNGDAGVGRVGIGTTNPNSLLTLGGAQNATVGISLGKNDGTTWPTVSRYIGITPAVASYGVNSGFSGIEFGGAASAAEGYLAFHTHDNGVSSGERMRIDKSGNVGIGTTGPTHKLDVVNTTLDNTAFLTMLEARGNVNTESANGAFDITKPSIGISFSRDWSSAGTPKQLAGIYGWGSYNWGGGLAFTTTPAYANGAQSTRMVITDGGSVGIGTTNPTQTVEIRNNSYNAGLLIDNTPLSAGYGKFYLGSVGASTVVDDLTSYLGINNGILWFRGNSSTGFNIFNGQNAPINFGTNNTQQMTILGSGNVGIGIANPGTNRLYVAGGSFRNSLATTHSTLGGVGATIVMADNNGTLYAGGNSVGNSDTVDTYHASQLQFYQSSRDFPSGTLIQTNINYNYDSGDPFLLEIEGNSYFNLVPVDLKVQGYIYSNTLIAVGGISNGLNIGGLVAFNYNGYLCFWFPSQGYWNGYNVFVNSSYEGVKNNRLVSITSAAKPGGVTKEVALTSAIRQSVNSDNVASYALPIGGGTMTGAINMGANTITTTGQITASKLQVTTIDPLYNINGINYATFASSISGGVKEEYVGQIKLDQKNKVTKEYEATVDFSTEPEGSDLWVWHQVVDFNQASVEVLLTPYGQFAQAYYLISGDKLIFRSDRQVELSYRLIGKRWDWKKWPTKAVDQSEKGVEIK